MKVSLTLAASACALVCAGCSGFLQFKRSGDGGTGGGTDGGSSFTNASSVNVYNCSNDETVMIYRAPVNSSEWTRIWGTGSSSTPAADCPDESDWAITVPIPDGDHVIRAVFKGINAPDCDEQVPNDPDCRQENKTFTGDNGGPIVDWTVGT